MPLTLSNTEIKPIDIESYVADGNKTLSQISRTVGVSVSEIINQNNDRVKSESQTDLVKLNTTNQPVPKDTQLFISTDISNVSNSVTITQTNKAFSTGGKIASRGSGKWTPPDYRNTNSHVVIFHGNHVMGQYPIPYPTSITEDDSPNFNSVNVFGRSVDFQIYTGSSRSVSFSLEFHEEMYDSPQTMSDIISAIKSACYPMYQNSLNVYPPYVGFKFGSHIGIMGILTSCNTSWDGPLVDSDTYAFGRIRFCKMSLGVRETKGPYDAVTIAKELGLNSGAFRYNGGTT